MNCKSKIIKIWCVVLLLSVPMEALLSSELSDETIMIDSKAYQAEILPRFGGNCISLKHKASNMDVLRRPQSIKDIENSPLLYGMPLLFFPNRIAEGTFLFENREYKWPINEPERNNHIHGALYKEPLKIIKQTASSVTFEYVATKDKPYLWFPHTFILRLTYTVNRTGLHQEVAITNTSQENMPVALAFHTTFQIPFIENGNIDDVRLELPVDREYLRDMVKLIPNEEYLDDFLQKDEFNNGTLEPNEHNLSRFFSRTKGKSMILTDTKSGWQVIYSADANYRFWMLWNGGHTHLLTVEHQSCMLDAFNIKNPEIDKGIISLAPKKTIKLKTSIKIKKQP